MIFMAGVDVVLTSALDACNIFWSLSLYEEHGLWMSSTLPFIWLDRCTKPNKSAAGETKVKGRGKD